MEKAEMQRMASYMSSMLSEFFDSYVLVGTIPTNEDRVEVFTLHAGKNDEFDMVAREALKSVKHERKHG